MSPLAQNVAENLYRAKKIGKFIGLSCYVYNTYFQAYFVSEAKGQRLKFRISQIKHMFPTARHRCDVC